MSPGTRPVLFGVAGHSGSGKTTLIEALIPILSRQGLKVGVLKHDAHRIELDRAGKDSFRAREAGAAAVAVASSSMIFMAASPPTGAGAEELASVLFGGMDLDLVLVEGYGFLGHPKLEVLHPDRPPRLDPHRDRVVAWVARGTPLQGGPRTFLAASTGLLIEFLQAEGYLPRTPALAAGTGSCA